MKLTEMKRLPLVEVVVLIIVLCLPAAWIMPRISMLMSKLNQIALINLSNSMRTAAALAHTKQTSNKLSQNSPVKMGKGLVSMRYGYPTADRNGISKAMGNHGKRFADHFNGIFDYRLAPKPSMCRVTYVAPMHKGMAPRIVMMTPGCLSNPITGK